jgi:hypothetical protein
MATNLRALRRSSAIIKSAVVVVQRNETKEQAWQRHIKKYPEDTYAHVRIFHFIAPNTFQNLLIA